MLNKLFCFILLVIFGIGNSNASVVYDCVFDKKSNQNNVEKTKFDLKIIADESKGVYYLVGNNGSAELFKIDNQYGVNFIEITDSGNVMVTTITDGGKAIHSRNSILFGDIIPSQYYGQCKIN